MKLYWHMQHRKYYFGGDSIHIACIQLVKDSVTCLCRVAICCAKTHNQNVTHTLRKAGILLLQIANG